jgi:hypothetical protein
MRLKIANQTFLDILFVLVALKAPNCMVAYLAINILLFIIIMVFVVDILTSGSVYRQPDNIYICIYNSFFDILLIASLFYSGLYLYATILSLITVYIYFKYYLNTKENTNG